MIEKNQNLFGMENQTTSSYLESKILKPGMDPVLQRRIMFRPARKQTLTCGPVSFNLEPLNPDFNASSSHNADPQKPLKPSQASKFEPKKSRDDSFDWIFEAKEHTIRRIGAGLANMGNTCFLNSVLQCLTYTQPLATYLLSDRHKITCRVAGFCAMCAFQDHVKSVLSSNCQILSPTFIVRNLRYISQNFRAGRQEDAHEYLVNLMQALHRCCLPAGISCESPQSYEISLLHKIFGGRLRSQVKCTQCEHCSDKFDPFLDLSLEVNQANSLDKALSHFTALEQLDNGEKIYQCENCKMKVRALKQLQIDEVPNILVVHLKRFNSEGKIDKNIDFPPTLDLKPFVTDSHKSNLNYTLYGVIVHSGWSTHAGHYFCFVRTSTGHWNGLNDEKVHHVSEKTVLEQKAYLLFYIRENSRVDTVNDLLTVKSNTANAGKTDVHLEGSLKCCKQNNCVPNQEVLEDENEVYHTLASQFDKSRMESSKPFPLNSSEIRSTSDNVFKLQLKNSCNDERLPKRAKKLVRRKHSTHTLCWHSYLFSHKYRTFKTMMNLTRKRYKSQAVKLSSKCNDINCKRKFHAPNGVSSVKSNGVRVAMPSSSTTQNTKDNNYELKAKDGNPSRHDKYEAVHENLESDKTKSHACGDGGYLSGRVSDHKKDGVIGETSSLKAKLYGSAVPHWDDMANPIESSENIWENNKSKIGYVLDEWDEDYDRGRRKKLKQFKLDGIAHTGDNPFQTIANNKVRVKS